MYNPSLRCFPLVSEIGLISGGIMANIQTKLRPPSTMKYQLGVPDVDFVEDSE